MDPTLELIKEILEILRNDANLTAALGSNNKVFDRVPEKQDGTPNVESPYISVGSTNYSSEDFDCVDAATLSIQLNCWSWGDGEQYSSAEVRKLAFLVRKALNNKEINLSQNGFVSLRHLLTAFNRASDGVTNQAAIQFESEIDII